MKASPAHEHLPWHRSRSDLLAGLSDLAGAPKDHGPIALLLRRPAPGEREELDAAEIDRCIGLVGDDWSRRPRPDPDAQLTLINTRAIDLLAASRERWKLSGDQIYVDLDLSEDGLPVGSQLIVGTALVEVTAVPHLGCAAFTNWFGPAATAVVNGTEGRRLRLRGVNTRVLRSGRVTLGDVVARA